MSGVAVGVFAAAGLAIALTLSGGAAPGAGAEGLAESRPNILVIMTDDQRRAGTLQIMDSLRKEFRRGGTDFVNAYATTPLCCPSRASILSGQYAHNHGIFTNDGTHFEGYPHDETLPSYLQSAGYRTGYFGKYFNKWPIEQAPPFFDEWAINSRESPYDNTVYNVDGEVRTITRYDTTYVTKQLSTFLEDAEGDDSRPWFAFVAPRAPHAPSTPERRYRRAHVGPWDGNPAVFEADRSDKHPALQLRKAGLHRAKRVRRAHLRTLLSVDDSIEKTFALLGALKERNNTLAVYLSDNGFLWRDHGVMAKREPFLPSPRIPLLVSGPGVARGAVDDRLAANIDIAPTLLEAAGIDTTEPMDGRSLFSEERRDRLLLEYWRSTDFPQVGPWAALLTHEDQYVEYYDEAGASLPTFREYYDLVEDPWQLENLLGDDDVTNDPEPLSLHEQLRRDRVCSGDGCP